MQTFGSKGTNTTTAINITYVTRFITGLAFCKNNIKVLNTILFGCYWQSKMYDVYQNNQILKIRKNYFDSDRIRAQWLRTYKYTDRNTNRRKPISSRHHYTDMVYNRSLLKRKILPKKSTKQRIKFGMENLTNILAQLTRHWSQFLPTTFCLHEHWPSMESQSGATLPITLQLQSIKRSNVIFFTRFE